MTIDRGAPARGYRGGAAVECAGGAGPERVAGADPALRLDLTYAAFCETHEPAWHALALTRIGNQADAVLVVETVKADLARCWPQVLRFEEPAAYAWRLANRHVSDWVAAEEPVAVEAVTFAAVIGAFKQVANGLLHSEADEVRLYAAILELPDRQRDVVILRYLLGLHVKVIAAYLGRPVATVHSNLRHARERLARRLGVGELPDRGGEL
ncbi:RNA polymerase sigma-70 factor (ECF subfamily) [Streptomyces sp. 1114.5]|uniref:RNA polymerase sigma factor n=1 Tax=unclassified Streptomyces TaxID=2593676 RepID=UPI000BCBD3BD|nr:MULTISPECIES: sigma-70 family RNA polymerase sigma factor [unclassified Streptomyces]RKT08803.1 RNA polymerase sigma-70 factor (ECF subfamily) [Streptomyces sp. 1114.5]SOB79084.1 RNA polymerase sigma-70 factor, ECF subfamily [Streptomyces sp. 1331.2]